MDWSLLAVAVVVALTAVALVLLLLGAQPRWAGGSESAHRVMTDEAGIARGADEGNWEGGDRESRE